MALGATSRQVIGTVMSESIPVVVGGVAAGLVAALVLGGLLEALLFQVASHDSVSLAAAGAGAAAIAMPSAFIAARTAARIDPLLAMRTE